MIRGNILHSTKALLPESLNLYYLCTELNGYSVVEMVLKFYRYAGYSIREWYFHQ
jgi:hypothetical protein